MVVEVEAEATTTNKSTEDEEGDEGAPTRTTVTATTMQVEILGPPVEEEAIPICCNVCNDSMANRIPPTMIWTHHQIVDGSIRMWDLLCLSSEHNQIHLHLPLDVEWYYHL